MESSRIDLKNFIVVGCVSENPETNGYLFHVCEYSRSEYEYKYKYIAFEYKYKYLKFVLQVLLEYEYKY